MAGVKVTGVQQVLTAISKAKVDTGKTIAAGLEACAGVVYRKSQKLVPVDKGRLKASGRYGVSGVGRAAKAFVEYGGPDAPYALYVHEDMTKRHPVGQAKFVEDAVRQTRGTMASIMRRMIKAKKVKLIDGEEV